MQLSAAAILVPLVLALASSVLVLSLLVIFHLYGWAWNLLIGN